MKLKRENNDLAKSMVKKFEQEKNEIRRSTLTSKDTDRDRDRDS